MEPPDYVLVIMFSHIVEDNSPVAETYSQRVFVGAELHSQNGACTQDRLVDLHAFRIVDEYFVHVLFVEDDLVDLREVVDFLDVVVVDLVVFYL